MNVRDFGNDVAIITREVTQAHLRFIGGEPCKAEWHLATARDAIDLLLLSMRVPVKVVAAKVMKKIRSDRKRRRRR
jgi:hypothetical protein